MEILRVYTINPESCEKIEITNFCKDMTITIDCKNKYFMTKKLRYIYFSYFNEMEIEVTEFDTGLIPNIAIYKFKIVDSSAWGWSKGLKDTINSNFDFKLEFVDKIERK